MTAHLRLVGRERDIDVDTDWMDDAACTGMDDDLWFARRGDYKAVKEAKTICAICPVRRECLDYAMRTKEPYGIWGGKTARQRERMRSRHGS